MASGEKFERHRQPCNRDRTDGEDQENLAGTRSSRFRCLRLTHITLMHWRRRLKDQFALAIGDDTAIEAAFA